MKSTPAVLIVTAFVASVFAIERITAAAPTEPATTPCAGSCDKACCSEKSCCEESEATAEAGITRPVVIAVTATTEAPETTACCGEKCECCQGKSCCKASATTAVTSAAEAIAGTYVLAAIDQAATTAETPACSGGHCQCCRDKSCCQQGDATAAKAAATATLACAATSEKTACCNGKCECAAACASELQRVGLDPYRIEPTDVLTIFIPALKFESEQSRYELASRGVITDAKLPFVGIKVQHIVRPDGRITLDGIGEIEVHGLTVDEARLAIMKKAFESQPIARRAMFGVFVDVPAKNSKKVYVLLQGGVRGDNIWQVPATTGTTVGSAFGKSAWPHPINFAATKIWISRPSGAGPETLLPVTWDASTGQPTCETNHALLPGDRVFVKLPTEQTRPVPPTPVAVVIPPAPLPPQQYRALTPPAAPQPTAPGMVSARYYAAVPAAVPSPFAHAPTLPGAAPPAIATQAYVTTMPPQQPPAPKQTIAAPYSDPESWARDGKQVQFNIAVVEDVTGSFSEFPKIREGLLMVSDSDATLGAVRIMEKQKLVKRISAPRLTCTIGEGATLCVAREADDETTESDSLSVNVKAYGTGQGAERPYMFVETEIQASHKRQIHEMHIGFRIEEGQTAIVRTCRQPRPFETEDERPVYIVLTPKLVK